MQLSTWFDPFSSEHASSSPRWRSWGKEENIVLIHSSDVLERMRVWGSSVLATYWSLLKILTQMLIPGFPPEMMIVLVWDKPEYWDIRILGY